MRRGITTVLLVLVAFLCGLPVDEATAVPPGVDDFQAVQWDRLRPLDSDPALNSGLPLNRPCIPGETVVVRRDHGVDAPQRLGLAAGQFVVCISNLPDGSVQVVDGPGNAWNLDPSAVNATRGFPRNWQAHDRDYLVWSYSRDTIIFRESLANSFEGNFFYLVLDIAESGTVNAGLLIDSGTGYANLRPYLRPILGNASLLVVSTHSHWDHFGGHRHLYDVGGVVALGYKPGPVYNPYPVAPEYNLEELRQYFALDDRPLGSAQFTVGSRRLTVLPLPGHTEDSVAFYDHREGLLFTGDTVCPCYFFIEDWLQFSESLRILEEFVAANPVRWLLGGHVEMSRKRSWNDMHEGFHFGSNTHWDPMPVQMSPEYVGLARGALERVSARHPGTSPQYDARYIDIQFHPVPVVPVPFPGIPANFRRDAERLVATLRARHAWHDARRAALHPADK